MSASPRIKEEPREEPREEPYSLPDDAVMGGTQEAAIKEEEQAAKIKEAVEVKVEPEAEATITGSRELSIRELIMDAQQRGLPRIKLFFIRQQFQNIHNQTRAAGPGTLSNETATKLKDYLKELSQYKFEDPEDKRVTKIDRAVKLLCNVSLFGDEISDKAQKVYNRMISGNWEPFDLDADEDDLGDSEVDSSLFGDSNDEDNYVSPPPGPSSSASRGLTDPNRTTTGYILRGILITNTNGRKNMKLDPNYPKRDAKVFGHNGCQVGDWWPFQLTTLRDGAHGARIGGITGGPHGAYSVVISGGSYDEQDADFGNEVWYSGNMGADNEGSRREAQRTPGVKALMKNEQNGRPVRVIRSGKSSTRHAPSYGYRYDGLYNVTEHRIRRATDGRYFYQFHLVRRGDQPPIDHTRPNPGEKRAHDLITS